MTTKCETTAVEIKNTKTKNIFFIYIPNYIHID